MLLAAWGFTLNVTPKNALQWRNVLTACGVNGPNLTSFSSSGPSAQNRRINPCEEALFFRERRYGPVLTVITKHCTPPFAQPLNASNFQAIRKMHLMSTVADAPPGYLLKEGMRCLSANVLRHCHFLLTLHKYFFCSLQFLGTLFHVTECLLN